MPPTQIQQILAKNRAEELGFDVWNQFVQPPFFERLSVGNTLKPKVILGGRGCGKTMLLRYLSHESTFSPARENIPDSALSHIGLYWRADTQFASLLQRRGLEEDTWAAAFRHLVAIVLGVEILRSLESIAKSNIGVLTEARLGALDFRRLQPFSRELPSGYNSLREFLEDRLAEFESWANDVRSVPQPYFLPGNDFLKRLTVLIRSQVVELEDAVFFVYVDEYENLAIYQQRIINTWLKHSESPIVFNLAMKRNGFKTRATEGEEALSDIHDFRDIDIEKLGLDTDFPLFAAEILILRLRLANLNPIPDSPNAFPVLPARDQPGYRERILAAAKKLFPGLTQRELADQVFSDPSLRERLKEKVTKALQMRNAASKTPETFILQAFPEASIIVPALLHRDTVSVSEVEAELNKLQNGAKNKFTGVTNWVHNNFVGCFLQLYDGLVRPCPFYSGFETFCFMSRGNLRHFLELSHQALGHVEYREGRIGSVSVEMQAQAARQVAADLLVEVRSFGPQGNNLYTFLLRLGSLFSLSQQRPAQSEPERTHFSIQGGETEMDETKLSFLSEAVKWSVLFEERGTKKKSESDPEGTEFVLNPIYAPYFHISYRKIRKLELDVEEITVLISSSYDEVRALLKKYQRRWSVDLSDASLPLFAHLEQNNSK